MRNVQEIELTRYLSNRRVEGKLQTLRVSSNEIQSYDKDRKPILVIIPHIDEFNSPFIIATGEFTHLSLFIPDGITVGDEFSIQWERFRYVAREHDADIDYFLHLTWKNVLYFRCIQLKLLSSSLIQCLKYVKQSIR